MLKLVKYQFIKNKYASLYAVVAVLLIYSGSFYDGINGNNLGLSGVFTDLIAIIGIPSLIMFSFCIFYFINFFGEIINEKVYMIYMTPNSGYKVVYSGLLYIILTFIFIFVLVLILQGIYSLNFPEYSSIDAILHAIEDQGVQISIFEGLFIIFIITFSLHVFILILCLTLCIIADLTLDKGWFVSLMGLATLFVIPELYIRMIEVIVYYLLINLKVSLILCSSITFGFIIIVAVIIATVAGYLLENKVNL